MQEAKHEIQQTGGMVLHMTRHTQIIVFLIHAELMSESIKSSLKTVVEKIKTLIQSKNRDICVRMDVQCNGNILSVN